MKKSTQKSGKSEKSYSADHVSIMLEGIHDAIMALGDGQEVLSDKVDHLDERLGTVEGKVDRLQDDVSDIKYKLSDKIERSEFEKLEKRMIKVERAVLSKRG